EGPPSILEFAPFRKKTTYKLVVPCLNPLLLYSVPPCHANSYQNGNSHENSSSACPLNGFDPWVIRTRNTRANQAAGGLRGSPHRQHLIPAEVRAAHRATPLRDAADGPANEPRDFRLLPCGKDLRLSRGQRCADACDRARGNRP